MKKEVYHKFVYGRKGIFTKIGEFGNKETAKRFGKKWAKEWAIWTKRINNSIRWLPEPNIKKGEKFYFKKLGRERYEQTLFKIHKEMLNLRKTPFRMNKKMLKPEKLRMIRKICFRKIIGKSKILYDSEMRRKIGKIIYEDKYQIGVK